jgi:HD-GYP domain-containing protein (c-di-GMP phosphodiesterase class II)
MDAKHLDAELLNHNQAIESTGLEERLLDLVARKDLSTLGHSNRVAELTREWAEFMLGRGFWVGVDPARLESAARLHDVGKIMVPDSVLLKAGPLDALERELMNAHAEAGYEMVKSQDGAGYSALAVRHHHERWDGQGYPLGLQGDEIPFQAQVVAVVDAFDAMTEDRVYRKGRSSQEALIELKRCAGSHFSPDRVAEFVQFIHARNG